MTPEQRKALLPTIQLRGEEPVQMQWLKQADALKYAEVIENAVRAELEADIERKDTLLRQARLHVATSIAVNNNDSKAENLYDAITKELQ